MPNSKGRQLRNNKNILSKFKKKFLPRTTSTISTKLGTKRFWVKCIQIWSNEEPGPFPRGDNYELAKMHWQNIKIFSLQNHSVNINQTCHKASCGKGNLSLFKWRATPFSKEKWLRNSENTLTTFKNLLLHL